MAAICPKCRFENPDDTNFCGKCATPLPGASDETPEAATKNIGRISRELATGTLIGAKYRILEKLGAGGMGEVYRAEDLSLNRQVAIKVLPDVFASDQERLARFQREAEVLAALNHQNIAAIYGVEEADGKRFLILELVEGETLAERLSKGPLAIEEALEVGLQIAEGLEGAHEKNIIHRDLKPSNVKITPAGKVKILDFGLARATYDQISEVDLVKSPTITADMTRPGIILGTAAYVSPEQAKGKAVDKRADIWAFGCVMFEMLTGRTAFTGKDITDILAAVIRGEPEWSHLPTNLHWRLREVLDRCLRKELRDRYHDISDVRVDLQKILGEPGGGLAQPITIAEPRRKLRLGLPGVAAVALLGVIIGGLALWSLRKPEARQVIRFDYQLPEGQEFIKTLSPILAISPNGKQIVYSTPQGLYLRSMDELTAKLIPGTEGNPQQPFFSPDGQWIGYFSVSDRKLKKISAHGGVPVVLCSVTELLGVSWQKDGTIVFGQPPNEAMRISANGGTPESLTKLKTGYFIVLAQILPDGKSVLYTSIESGHERILVKSPKAGEAKDLLEGYGAQFLPTGHIVYELNGNILAARFDPDRLEVIGGPVPVVESVGDFAFSESGTMVYIPRTGPGIPYLRRTLVWVDRGGKKNPSPLNPALTSIPGYLPMEQESL